jgi:TetR/AcrR family transcriptional repressor of lmrAB and yxaGH operons
MNTRDKIIETTSNLLETQGYHGTAMSQIVEFSQSPRGSMYYHFPGGKEELAEVAVQHSGELFSGLIQKNLREDLPIAQAVEQFVLGIAIGVERSGYSSGGPLTAIAMETATTNEKINLACRKAFTSIQAVIEDKLLTSGIETEKAEELAVFITSSIEGGIILSRTHHDGSPLRTVAKYLKVLLEKIE